MAEEFSDKIDHSERLKFSKGLQDRFVIQFVVVCDFAQLHRLSWLITAAEDFSC
jgi:hypothetical protein